MSELTKEYFEQYLDTKLDGFVTKEYFDSKIGGLATKGELLATRNELKKDLSTQINSLEGRLVKKFDDGIEELARMVADGFADVQRRLDVTARVEHLEVDMSKIKGALNIS